MPHAWGLAKSTDDAHSWKVRREPDPIATARHRAYDLADTGGFWGWRSISDALVAEGGKMLIVRHLESDSYFKFRLRQRIKNALVKRHRKRSELAQGSAVRRPVCD